LVTQNSVAVTVVARQVYYDRNPTQVALQFAQVNTAPHTVATRVTYTVPTVRKAIFAGVFIQLVRVTAAGTPGAITVNQDAGGILRHKLNTLFNTVGNTVGGGISGGDVLVAAQTADLQDADASTGGAVDYEETVDIVEFDQ
jgi:hypothetical protein